MAEESLSLEQQFNIRSFEHQCEGASREQLKDLLLNMYKQMLLQENSYKALLKKEWGILEPCDLN